METNILVLFENGAYMATCDSPKDIIDSMLADLEEEMEPRDRVRLAAVLDKWQNAKVQQFSNVDALKDAMFRASRRLRSQNGGEQRPIIVGS